MIDRLRGYESEPTYIKDARERLVSVGLTLEDLSKYDKVLDIGAKDCEIQQAGEHLGSCNVLSIDRRFPDAVRKSGMLILQNEAGSLELPDASADLAVVRSSAYYYTQTEDETLSILVEINRVLKSGGEQRIYPARFGHVIKQLLDTYPEFATVRSTAPEHRSKKQVEVIQFYDNLANSRTVDFLKEHSIFVKKVENAESLQRDHFRNYLIIPKF